MNDNVDHVQFTCNCCKNKYTSSIHCEFRYLFAMRTRTCREVYSISSSVFFTWVCIKTRALRYSSVALLYLFLCCIDESGITSMTEQTKGALIYRRSESFRNKPHSTDNLRGPPLKKQLDPDLMWFSTSPRINSIVSSRLIDKGYKFLWSLVSFPRIMRSIYLE